MSEAERRVATMTLREHYALRLMERLIDHAGALGREHPNLDVLAERARSGADKLLRELRQSEGEG